MNPITTVFDTHRSRKVSSFVKFVKPTRHDAKAAPWDTAQMPLRPSLLYEPSTLRRLTREKKKKSGKFVQVTSPCTTGRILPPARLPRVAGMPIIRTSAACSIVSFLARFLRCFAKLTARSVVGVIIRGPADGGALVLLVVLALHAEGEGEPAERSRHAHALAEAALLLAHGAARPAGAPLAVPAAAGGCSAAAVVVVLDVGGFLVRVLALAANAQDAEEGVEEGAGAAEKAEEEEQQDAQEDADDDARDGAAGEAVVGACLGERAVCAGWDGGLEGACRGGCAGVGDDDEGGLCGTDGRRCRDGGQDAAGAAARNRPARALVCIVAVQTRLAAHGSARLRTVRAPWACSSRGSSLAAGVGRPNAGLGHGAQGLDIGRCVVRPSARA